MVNKTRLFEPKQFTATFPLGIKKHGDIDDQATHYNKCCDCDSTGLCWQGIMKKKKKCMWNKYD